MQFNYSYHWAKKRKFRDDISEDMIYSCIKHSNKIRDRYWEDAFNAIANMPNSGRTLKVVYKIKGETIKILTAYWLK